MPNVPCLVSVAPIVVTKCDMTVTLIDPVTPAVGDSLTFALDQVGSPAAGAQYRYIVALIPEADYAMAVDMTTDGTINNTAYNVDCFSMQELIQVLSDGSYQGTTVNIQGKNGSWALTPDDLMDASLLQDIFLAEAGASNMSVSITNPTSSTNGILVTLSTKPAQMSGKLVVIAAALNTQTGSISAFNQSYMDLNTKYTLNLKTGWNLVSYPVVNSTFKTSVLKGTPALIIAAYNNSTGDFDAYNTVASPLTYDITMKTDVGYFIYCTSDTSIVVYGMNPENRNRPIYQGWNLIGWSSLTGMNAKAVCYEPLLAGRQIIARYNATTGDFDAYAEDISTDVYDYMMHDGVGYYVYSMTAAPQTLYYEAA
jgi:hypothetical protein